jgi:hypothetical protein
MSQQINLFNPVFLKQRKLFSAPMMAQALGLVALVTAACGGYAYYQAARIGKEAATVSARLAHAQERLVQTVDKAKQPPLDKSVEEALQREEQKLADAQRVLAFIQGGALGQSERYTEYFRALSRKTMPGLWLTGFMIANDGGIEIRGRALQPALVPSYLKDLRGEAVFAGKSFGGIAMRAGAEAAAEDKPRGTGAPKQYLEFMLSSSSAALEQRESHGEK